MILLVFAALCLLGVSHAVPPVAFSEPTVEVDDVSFTDFQTVNQMVDFILQYMSAKLEREGLNKIQLADLHKRFKTKLMKLEGGFKITEGWASNVTNLYRNGDAQMTMDGADSVITAHIGFRNLGVHFGNYEIYFAKIRHTGKINVVFGSYSMLLKIRVTHIDEGLKQSCSAVMEELKVEILEDIKVHITNIGLFEHLKNKIHSWVGNHVSRWFTGYTQETLMPSLREIIETVNFCSVRDKQ